MFQVQTIINNFRLSKQWIETVQKCSLRTQEANANYTSSIGLCSTYLSKLLLLFILKQIFAFHSIEDLPSKLKQVSHHPTLIACHCEGNGWKFWGDSNLRTKFWGRSIQLDPVGVLTLEFDDGEIFQWSKVCTIGCIFTACAIQVFPYSQLLFLLAWYNYLKF